MSKSVTAPYTAARFTVVLPTGLFLLVFFAIWLGIPALLSLRWNIPGWLALLTLPPAVVAGFATAVVAYGPLLGLAEGKRGELVLDGDRLCWRTGRRWREVDFSRPHRVAVAAGRSGLGKAHANITIFPLVEILHLHGISRDEVLRHIPAPYFVSEVAPTSTEGLWGFELRADDPAGGDFVRSLLDTIWRNRARNALFRLYERYPWDRRPEPSFRCIRFIETKDMAPEDRAFIARLSESFIDDLADSSVRVTPDYLVGWVYRSWKSTWSGQPDCYCVMPLGYVSAEVSLPRPDWKPFVVGQLLMESAAALGGSSRSYGPSLQHRRYLYVTGPGEGGERLELAFDWYEPTDERWGEAEVFVRFVQHARLRARG